MNVTSVYVAVVLIWSTTPLGIRFSVASFDFIQGLSLRMWLSILVCWALHLMFRVRLPWHKGAVQGYLLGAIPITFAMLCVYYAAQTLPSGLIAVMWGLSPILVSVCAMILLPNAHLVARQWMAMGLAVVGLYIIFAQGIAIGWEMLGALLVLLLGLLLHCVSSVWLQRLHVVKGVQPANPLAQTTGALMLSAPVYGLLWCGFSGPLPEQPEMKSMVAIVYLAIFGSVVGFIGYFYLMKHLSAATVSLVTLVTPVLALILGALLANEALAPRTFIGSSVILLSLVIYQWRSINLALLQLRSRLGAE